MEKLKEIEEILNTFNSKIELANKLESENPEDERLKKLDEEIRNINDALDSIMYDKFYFIIEYYYFEKWNKERIMKEFKIDYPCFNIHRDRLLTNLIRLLKL